MFDSLCLPYYFLAGWFQLFQPKCCFELLQIGSSSLEVNGATQTYDPNRKKDQALLSNILYARDLTMNSDGKILECWSVQKLKDLFVNHLCCT